MTRQRIALGFVLTCAAIGFAVVPSVADHHEESAAPMVAEGLEFMPLGEGSPAQFAIVYGDPAVGPCAILIDAPPGHRNPMHAHSSSYSAVVISGSVKQWNDGQTEDQVSVLEAGATLKQPAGRYHAELVGDGGVLAFVSFDGPMDFIPKEGETP